MKRRHFRCVYHLKAVKTLLTIIVIWSLVGLSYFIFETAQWLEIEATIDPASVNPFWKIVLYGPIYWVTYLILQLVSLFLK